MNGKRLQIIHVYHFTSFNHLKNIYSSICFSCKYLQIFLACLKILSKLKTLGRINFLCRCPTTPHLILRLLLISLCCAIRIQLALELFISKRSISGLGFWFQVIYQPPLLEWWGCASQCLELTLEGAVQRFGHLEVTPKPLRPTFSKQTWFNYKMPFLINCEVWLLQNALWRTSQFVVKLTS